MRTPRTDLPPEHWLIELHGAGYNLGDHRYVVVAPDTGDKVQIEGAFSGAGGVRSCVAWMALYRPTTRWWRVRRRMARAVTTKRLRRGWERLNWLSKG